MAKIKILITVKTYPTIPVDYYDEIVCTAGIDENGGDEIAACVDVKKKYWDDFAKTKDLYFYLGTTKLHHLRAPNPFIIIGTLYPKKEQQLKLNF